MMTSRKWTAVAVVLLAGMLGAAPAFAWGRHHSHVFLGFNFGFPAYYPAPFYYYPPAYYPPPVIVQSSPPVYVERQEAAPAPPSQAYWYYCPATRGYYPYVKECPAGWQKVPPQPAG